MKTRVENQGRGVEDQTTSNNRHGNNRVNGVNKRKKNKLLKLANINARSLCTKMKDLQYIVTKVVEPQLISISESWGKEEIADCNFNLDGYKMYRDDRHQRGGGAILYIKSELNQRE